MYKRNVVWCRVYLTWWYQPFKSGWRLWFYRMRYDGLRLWALHLGPLVIGTDWEPVGESDDRG